jgi:hypothetical protein
MENDISGTNVAVWVKHVLSPSPQVRRAKELENFTRRFGLSSKVGESLGMATRGLMETFFGRDLKDVRIHRGQEAEDASCQLTSRAFTLGRHIFGPRQNLDDSTREGLGLLAHELTHVIQQTRPNKMPQRQTVHRGNDLSPAIVPPPASHSDGEMVLLAPARSSPQGTASLQREARARASEQLVTKGSDDQTKAPSEINCEEVANKVYRLMRYDLVLEQERVGR